MVLNPAALTFEGLVKENDETLAVYKSQQVPDFKKALMCIYAWADNHADINNAGGPNAAMEVQSMIREMIGDDFINREWKSWDKKCINFPCQLPKGHVGRCSSENPA